MNTVSGRLALRDGDVKKAKEFLLASANVEGSAQLDSFGPNMSLAKELLDRGIQKEVIVYLERCALFWEFGKDKLDQWIQVIKQGSIPDFGGNMKY